MLSFCIQWVKLSAVVVCLYVYVCMYVCFCINPGECASHFSFVFLDLLYDSMPCFDCLIAFSVTSPSTFNSWASTRGWLPIMLYCTVCSIQIFVIFDLYNT